jgi:hypothetical protein
MSLRNVTDYTYRIPRHFSLSRQFTTVNNDKVPLHQSFYFNFTFSISPNIINNIGTLLMNISNKYQMLKTVPFVPLCIMMHTSTFANKLIKTTIIPPPPKKHSSSTPSPDIKHKTPENLQQTSLAFLYFYYDKIWRIV